MKNRFKQHFQKASENAKAIVAEKKGILADLSEENYQAVAVYNRQICQQLYHASPEEISDIVYKSVSVRLDLQRSQQYSESIIPNKKTGQHYYVAALPVNANVAPSTRTYLQKNQRTPLESHPYLNEGNLQFSPTVISDMMSLYQSRTLNVDIEYIFAQFQSRENWVLDSDLPEVQHFYNELAKVFNVFSRESQPLRAFIEQGNNAMYLIMLLDMMAVQDFTLFFNWLIAQDITAINQAFHKCNQVFENIFKERKNPNYQKISQSQRDNYDRFIVSLNSVYERIRYFSKLNVMSAVFGEKNQSSLNQFLNQYARY